MKIGVFGTRSISDDAAVIGSFVSTMREMKIDIKSSVFLVGGAQGPSTFIKEYVDSMNGDTVLFKPWHLVNQSMQFSTLLFYLRNKQIVDNSDMVLAFQGDVKDTEIDSALRYADKMGVAVVNVNILTEEIPF